MLSKTCFKCKQLLSQTAFYKHSATCDGRLGKCKECTKRDVRECYAAHREERAEYERMRSGRQSRKSQRARYQRNRRRIHPTKYRASNAVSNAVRDGRLVRRPCELCGDVKAQAHHDNYDKALEVRWLCFKHHRELHGQIVTSPF